MDFEPTLLAVQAEHTRQLEVMAPAFETMKAASVGPTLLAILAEQTRQLAAISGAAVAMQAERTRQLALEAPQAARSLAADPPPHARTAGFRKQLVQFPCPKC